MPLYQRKVKFWGEHSYANESYAVYMYLPVTVDALDLGVDRYELGLEELSLSKLASSLF